MTARRSLDYRSYGELWADVERLQRDGYERAGQWSLTQICQHLQSFMEASLHGFTDRLPFFVPYTIGPIYLKLALARRRLPSGLPAPPQIRPPEGPENPQVIAAFHQTIQAVTRADATFVRSPFLGTLPATTWREFHLVHASHHLSHLMPRGT
ncbi:MAG: DUF1569 domain-containing protein [Candidatus Xenobia bacterium]